MNGELPYNTNRRYDASLMYEYKKVPNTINYVSQNSFLLNRNQLFRLTMFLVTIIKLPFVPVFRRSRQRFVPAG